MLGLPQGHCALWALSPGTQHTPPAVFPSLQACPGLPTQGWAAHKHNTALGILDEQGLEDNSPSESPCCWSTKPWDGQELRREGSLACRDCSDATRQGFVAGSGLAVENAKSIL